MSDHGIVSKNPLILIGLIDHIDRRITEAKISGQSEVWVNKDMMILPFPTSLSNVGLFNKYFDEISEYYTYQGYDVSTKYTHFYNEKTDNVSMVISWKETE